MQKDGFKYGSRPSTGVVAYQANQIEAHNRSMPMTKRLKNALP